MIIVVVIIALIVLAALGLLVFIGLRTGRGDLVAPPREFGQRKELPKIDPPPVSLPPVDERPELASTPTPPSEPETPPGPFTRSPDAQPQSSAEEPDDFRIKKPTRTSTPPARTEYDYSSDELIDREVRAMLLQNRRDRAIAYVCEVKRVDAAEAEAIIQRIEKRG